MSFHCQTVVVYSYGSDRDRSILCTFMKSCKGILMERKHSYFYFGKLEYMHYTNLLIMINCTKIVKYLRIKML